MKQRNEVNEDIEELDDLVAPIVPDDGPTRGGVFGWFLKWFILH